MNAIVLIGCSARKLKTDTAVPAEQLYQGQLFKAQLAFARQNLHMPDDRIFVLSALHGLVRLGQQIRPYDKMLGQISAVERAAWGKLVLRQIEETGIPVEVAFVLAGKLYRGAIENPVFGLFYPFMRGLGYAQQVQWYKARLENGC